jgi:acylphosphatase
MHGQRRKAASIPSLQSTPPFHAGLYTDGISTYRKALRFFAQASSLLQFRRFVNEPKQAKKYLISGAVQGVGFRYFTQRAAARLKVGGYVKNLHDGRVEVFVMGTPQQLRELRTVLERGPRFSSVTEVREEVASPDPQYEQVFEIGYSD